MFHACAGHNPFSKDRWRPQKKLCVSPSRSRHFTVVSVALSLFTHAASEDADRRSGQAGTFRGIAATFKTPSPGGSNAPTLDIADVYHLVLSFATNLTIAPRSFNPSCQTTTTTPPPPPPTNNDNNNRGRPCAGRPRSTTSAPEPPWPCSSERAASALLRRPPPRTTP